MPRTLPCRRARSGEVSQRCSAGPLPDCQVRRKSRLPFSWMSAALRLPGKRPAATVIPVARSAESFSVPGFARPLMTLVTGPRPATAPAVGPQAAPRGVTGHPGTPDPAAGGVVPGAAEFGEPEIALLGNAFSMTRSCHSFTVSGISGISVNSKDGMATRLTAASILLVSASSMISL